MVNKCSAIGCKSLYVKEIVKLHRFPLTNKETLPVWITATGREEGWTPCKSSRLCGNHFQESEYIVGHGKGVLKSTAIPTIEYRVDIPRYHKKKTQKLYNNLPHTNKMIKVEENDPNFEIVQLNFKDVFDTKYEHKDTVKIDNSNENQEVQPYQNNYSESKNDQTIMESPASVKTYNDNEDVRYDDEEDNSNDSIKYISDNSNNEIQNEICNRENQCYMFTSSFKEGEEPLILSTPDEKSFEESPRMKIDQIIADSSFNKIMASKITRQRRTKDIYSLYFKSLKKRSIHKQEKNTNSFNNETASFGAFIEAQMKELRPYKKIYLTTKHKIQKILMRAQLKISN